MNCRVRFVNVYRMALHFELTDKDLSVRGDPVDDPRVAMGRGLLE